MAELLGPTPAHTTRTGETVHTINPTRVFGHRDGDNGQTVYHTAQLQPDGKVYYFIGGMTGKSHEITWDDLPKAIQEQLTARPLAIPEAITPGQVLETCVICGDLKPSGVMKSHLIDHIMAGQLPDGVDPVQLKGLSRKSKSA